MAAQSPLRTPSGQSIPVTKGSKGLLDFIASHESGGSYTKIWGGEEIPGLTDMTIRQVVDVQKRHLAKGNESAAIGRYQMMLPDVYGPKAGLSLDDKFSEANQDKMAMVYLEEDGYSKFKSGNMSADQFADNVAGTWAALPLRSGASAHAGVGSNASTTDRQTFMKHINASKLQRGGSVGNLSYKPSQMMQYTRQLEAMYNQGNTESNEPIIVMSPPAPQTKVIERSGGKDNSVPELSTTCTSWAACDYRKDRSLNVV
jgi:muramidase (phage lysozyme)